MLREAKNDMLDHPIDMFIKPLDWLQISMQIQRQKLEQQTRCGADCGWACLLPQQGQKEAGCGGYSPSVPPQTSPAADTPAALLLVRYFGVGGFLPLGIWLIESPLVGAWGILGWRVTQQNTSSLQVFNITQKPEADHVFVGCECSSAFLDQMSILLGTGLLLTFCTIPVENRFL